MVRVLSVLRYPLEVLHQMAWLLIARCLYDRYKDYDAIYARWPFLFGTFWIVRRDTAHADTFNKTKIVNHCKTYWNLLTTMKINVEGTDYCTNAARAMFQDLRAKIKGGKEYRRLCQQLIKYIVFFGSRQCLHDLRNYLNTPSSDLRKRTIGKDLEAVIRSLPEPSTWFTRSFNPNRITRRRIKKSKRPHTLTVKLFKAFSKRAAWKSCGLHGARRLTKRTVASRLGRRLGPFVGKNFLQLCKLAVPSLFNKKIRSRNMYSETGPGCRGALNQLEGWPKTVNIYSNTQDIADLYNALLVKWHKVWRRYCRSIEAELPPDLQPTARWLSDLDESEFQFVLCELSKIMAYVESEGVIYTRNYWADRL